MFLDELSRVLRLNVPADEKVKLAKAETEKIMLAEDELERQRIIALRTRYKGVEEIEVPALRFSADNEVDLSVARTNKVIWDRPGKGIFIRYCDTNVWNNTKIRFDNPAAPMFPIMPGYMKMDFTKIYLTNTAQAGKVFVFVIGHQKDAEYRMLDIALYNLRDDLLTPLDHMKLNNVRAACTPTIYNIAITSADAEYSQAIPEGTKRFRAVLADGTAFRLAWVAGKVATPTAPYWTQPANIPYVEESGLFTVVTPLYFACGTGTKVMQIECWV